tara:strand:- start:260 stop:712 length:453 start_codon:yes stop_codon:yes gene_type:complete
MSGSINDSLTLTSTQLATPLHVACSENQPSIIKLLLSHPDIDVNVTTSSGTTPLMLAITWCHEDNILQDMIADDRFDINMQNNSGETCLMLAAQCWRKSHVVRALLQRSTIDLDIKNISDETALDLARRCHCEEIENAILQRVEINLINL